MKDFSEELSQAEAYRDVAQQAKMYEQLAKQGCAEAQYRLAVCYYEGSGVKEDHEMSIGWLRRAAAGGDESAPGFLGGLLLHSADADEVAEGERLCREAMERGEVTAYMNLGNYYYYQDRDAEAVALFRYAADAGFTPAVYKLGLCYYCGHGVEENNAAAFQLFREAALQGDAAAAYHAALCCYRGHGTTEDEAEGNRWLAMAAEQDYAPALVLRGKVLIKDETTRAEGVQLLTRAAEQGEEGAMFELYIYFSERGEDETAEPWLRRAAAAGHRAAQCDLGQLLLKQGDSEEQEAEGLRWTEMAAAQGDVTASYNLGIYYEHHTDVPEAEQKAFRAMESAAAKEYLPAIYRLSKYYYMGLGVAKDREKAIASLRYAADGGYADAAYSYASFLLEGDGVPQDVPAALRYFRLALAGGSGEAAYRLGLCYATGTGVKENHDRFLAYMRRAAHMGAVEQVFRMAHTLCQKEIYEDAYALYRLIADMGYVSAMWHQAVLLERGLGCEKDEAAAERLFRRGAAKGDAECMASYALLQEKQGDNQGAFRMWKKAAAAGHKDAELRVAYAYDVGCGVKKNEVKANALYHAILEKGENDAAANNLGYNYLYGFGTKKSAALGFRYLSMAVQQGSRKALLHLGKCYLYGWGTEPDVQEALRLLQRSAKQGNGEAMETLGEIYGEGTYGIARDSDKAAAWWRKGAALNHAECTVNYAQLLTERGEFKRAFCLWKKAADLGDTEAEFQVAYAYDVGQGVRQNQAKANALYRAILEKRASSAAANNLGYNYLCGQGTKENNDLAFRYLSMAVQMGDKYAPMHLGRCYLNGWGTKPDIEESVRLLKLAAKYGRSGAMYTLGQIYFFGKLGIERDYRAAAHWWRKGAELGHEDCMEEYALCLSRAEGVRRNHVKALAWWKKGAELHHIPCICNVGCSYFHGHGTKRDYAEAVRWFRLGMELSNDATIAYNLGKRYLHGQGVEKNYAEALHYIRISADQNYPDALNTLGYLYERGYGVEKDAKRAFNLYARAARRGSASGQHSLGHCYERGIGTAPNLQKALELYTKAAEGDDSDAKRALTRLKKKS